jgi:dTDP-glucose 4,6-dehydratase
MKKVLVTGGAGFIGSEFVRKLISLNEIEKIIVLDKLTYAGKLQRISNELNDERVLFIKADLNQTNLYSSFLSEIDTIVNFAAESHVDNSIKNGYPFLKTNVLGTFSLLDSARVNMAMKILHVSTDEVYGSINYGESLETDSVRPSSTYSASKASSELIALSQKKTFGQNIVITRCCNNYGNWQDLEKVIPKFIHCKINGTKMPIYGNGLHTREWIHVSDHVNALVHILNSKIDYDVVNIGTGDRLNNLELAKIIASKFDLENNYFELIQDRPGHDYRYALSNKLITETGWKPSVKFNQGISDTVEWYKRNIDKLSEV